MRRPGGRKVMNGASGSTGSRSCINAGNFPPRFMSEVSLEAHVLTKDSATRASESGSFD